MFRFSVYDLRYKISPVISPLCGDYPLIDLSKIAVVVLTCNRRKHFEINLPILVSISKDYGTQLIVVDNGSSDGTAELIQDYAKKYSCLQVVTSPKNCGVAAGRNLGWQLADRDFILNIDDDISITASDMHSLLTHMLANDDVGVLSPVVLRRKLIATKTNFEANSRSVSNFDGACHMVRRTVVELIGFNDELCTYGGEELDYSIRTREVGFDVCTTSTVTLIHHTETIPARDDIDRRRRWLYNYVRVHHKHFPAFFAARLSLRYHFTAQVVGLQRHGFRLAFPLMFSAWQGFLDGRSMRKVVSPVVVKFYANAKLTPDFGNIPLYKKAIKKLLSLSV